MIVEARRSPFVIACALLAVAGAAESAEPAADSDLRAELTERIRRAQSEDGQYSKELIDPLESLSVTYEEDGNHASALATLDQAQQVVRANYGLSALEQVPLIRHKIRNEQYRGNAAGVWNLERELLALAARHPDDLRTVGILHELGDKRMQLLRRYLNGEYPPELTLGCYYAGEPRVTDEWRKCDAGQRSVAAHNMLMDAQRNYAHAIDVFLRQQLYSSDELRQLEAKLLRNSYLYRGYDHGKQSLQRLVRYDVANGAPRADRVAKLLELADWELLFERRPSALAQYAQIYSVLEQQGVSRAEIDEIFSAATPVALPAFERQPFARAEDAGGYVDMAFDITRFGTTRRIDVVDSSDASSRDVARVVRWLVQTHFRPKIADGEAQGVRVTARYYVHD